MKYSWIATVIMTALLCHVLYNAQSVKNEAYQQGYAKGAHEALYSVQSRAVFLDRDSIYQFEEWKKACEDKWKVDCGLDYFKIDGVGVYQVSPKQSD